MTASDKGLFISCGEISGDSRAASLITALRERGYSGDVTGMLGERSVAAGGRRDWDSRALHLMGVGDVVPAIPRLIRLKNEMTEAVLGRNPAVVAVIDSPDFHLPFIAALRKRNWKGKIVYAIPPSVWAWRSGRTKALARDTDLCLPLFRFEHEFLLKRGVRSEWRGHPMVDEFLGYSAPAGEDLPGDGERRIALLPGSRRSEITRLLKPLKDCAALLRKCGFAPVFSIAPGLPGDLRDFMMRELRGEDVFDGEGRDLMANCIAVAGASGTASVEAMMLGRFMAVLYKGGFLSWAAWKTMIRTPFISIPNILAGKEIYPEFIQGRATGKNVFAALSAFLQDLSFRRSTEEGIARARSLMGTAGALGFWAETLFELLRSPQGEIYP